MNGSMAGKTKRDDGPVLIKKYANRRLYDTRQSRYITLGELARMVQAGATVKIVDAASGKNLTRQVLLQVILEQQDVLEMIPVEFLHVAIRTQGTLEQAPFSAFLSAFTKQLATAGQLWTQPMANLFHKIAGAAGVGQASPAPATDGPETAVDDAEPPDEDPAAPAAEAEGPPNETSGAPPDDPPDRPSQPAAVEGLRRRNDGLLKRLDRRAKNDG